MNPKENPIEELLLSPVREIAPGEVILGQLSALSPAGDPMVDFALNPAGKAISATATMAIDNGHTGRQVALMFVDGSLDKPLIIGLIHSPLQEMIESFELSTARQGDDALSDELDSEPAANLENIDDVLVDGKRVVLEGRDEVVLRCGESSITLTSSGKILIRGRYLLSRSSGVNRIHGASVQVN